MQLSVLCIISLMCFACTLVTSEDQQYKPVYQEDDVFGPKLLTRGDREKKAIELKLAKGFGVKRFLLDLIFGKVNQVIDYKTRLVKQLDRTNRYKNVYLLGLGTPPKGVAAAGGQVSVGASAGVGTGARSESGILTNAGGLGSAFGAITGLLGGLNVGVTAR